MTYETPWEPEEDGRYDADPMTDEDFQALDDWIQAGCPDIPEED
jgi:hypothetical protein